MNIEPIQKFFQSKEALAAGDRESAEQLLAEAVGMPAPNAVLRGSLDVLLSTDNPNLAVFRLIHFEMEKD